MSNQDPIALVGAISATMEQMKKDNDAVMAELKTAATTAGKDAKDAIAKAEELASKLTGASNAIVEMEQKLADKVMSNKAAPETLGQMVIKSDAYKMFAEGRTGKMVIQANTITGQEGSPAANSDILVPSQRLSGIIPGAFRALRVRDVLPSGVTGSNSIEYTRELLFTNAAAETAEGAQKPEATLTFELVNAPVKTIAHIIKVSKQVLEDSAMLQSYVDTRLRYGVDLKFDNQLLKGDGTGQNISGMLDSGNFTAFTPTTGENALDSINRAIYKVYEADYAPTAIIMNPTDWGKIERTQVGTGDARYVIGNPVSGTAPMLWGMPVVVTNNMTAGTFVVGAFDIAYQVFNRQGTTVEMFEQDSDNVQKNLLTVRAEGRAALAVYRPASVFSGSLTA